MRISPPIGALCIVAAAIAGTAWLAPKPTNNLLVTVMLPADVYRDLEQRGQRLAGDGGTVWTVPQVIQALAGQAADPSAAKD